MKKFFVNVLLAGCLVVVLLAVAVKAVPKDKDAYLIAYNKKCLLLDSVPSPRIVFVGGSNLCFGLDSRRIKDSLDVNVVNYGLHAGIGLKFMTDDVAQYVREGDIVVFVPEYAHFYGLAYGEAMTIAPLMAYSRWEKMGMLDGRQLLQVLIGVPNILKEGLAGFLPKKETAYRLSGINEYGDEFRHWNLPGRAILEEKNLDGDMDEAFACYFIRKIEEMEKKARVLMVPPVIRASSYKMQEQRAVAISRFLQENGHPFLVPATHHVLLDSCAYDTGYHQNKQGVDRFTALLIEELRAALLHADLR